MIDSEDLCVPIWMGTSTNLWRLEHNIAASVGVDRIMIAADIVRSVVDRKLLCGKYGIVDNSNRIPFFICKKTGIIAVKAFPKESAEEMVAKFEDKILEFE